MCIPDSLGRIHTERKREREKEEGMDGCMESRLIGWVADEGNFKHRFEMSDGDGRKGVSWGKEDEWLHSVFSSRQDLMDSSE